MTRTKSIHTRVTPEEYEAIQTLAGDEPMSSEWVRRYLLERAKQGPLETALMGELRVLRKIVINTVQIATGVDQDLFRALVAEADGGADGEHGEPVEAEAGTVVPWDLPWEPPPGEDTLDE